jgi:hypothetical protein
MDNSYFIFFIQIKQNNNRRDFFVKYFSGIFNYTLILPFPNTPAISYTEKQKF